MRTELENERRAYRQDMSKLEAEAGGRMQLLDAERQSKVSLVRWVSFDLLRLTLRVCVCQAAEAASSQATAASLQRRLHRREEELVQLRAESERREAALARDLHVSITRAERAERERYATHTHTHSHSHSQPQPHTHTNIATRGCL